MNKWSRRSFSLVGLCVVACGLASCGPGAIPGTSRFEAASESSCNFVQNLQGQRVSWKRTAPVGLWIHESVPSHLINSLYSALAQWEYSLGRPLFYIAGIKGGEARPSQDGESVIYWMEKWEGNQVREQARTTIYWVGDRIREADIMINAENHDLVAAGDISRECLRVAEGARLSQAQSLSSCGDPKVDFESLMVHELGHVLGLQHTEQEGSVMVKELPYNVLRTVPQRVDLESLACEY